MKQFDMVKLSPYLASFVGGALAVVLIILGYATYMTRMAPDAEPKQDAEAPGIVTPQPENEQSEDRPQLPEREVIDVNVIYHDEYVDIDEREFVKKLPAVVVESQQYDPIGEIAELGIIESGQFAGAKLYEFVGYELGLGSFAANVKLIGVPNEWGHEAFFVQSRKTAGYADSYSQWPEDQIVDRDRTKEFDSLKPEGAYSGYIIRVSNLPTESVSDIMPKTVRLLPTGVLRGGYKVEFSKCIICGYGGENETYEKAFKTAEGIQLYYTRESILGGVGAANERDPDTLVAFDRFGTPYAYSSFLGLVLSSEETEQSFLSDAFRSSAVLYDIDWLNGYANNDNFILSRDLSGCGFGPRLTYSAAELGSLKRIGRTPTDGDVFIPENFENHTLTKEAYDMWFTYDQNGEKPSYEAFLQRFKVPYFLWQDAFERWIKYDVADLIPPAECGKPVIYLYPEQETNVHVAIPRFINVTVSEPAYPVEGWSVTAKPNGQLTMKDGSVYGSLFWEGTGVSYQVPETGFVVSRDEISDFLAEILPKYGLNETETREFMEFWIPELQTAKYYRLSFLTDEFDKAAPLKVTPKPDTTIRLFMDVKPLAESIEINEPQIIRPKRNGFTLVEWGGLLYR